MRPTGRARPVLLAGWLFADLFLLLMIVGLGAMPAASSTRPSPTPAPTTTSAPKPPPGLDPRYVDLTIPYSPDAFRAGGGDELVRQVTVAVEQADPTHRPVGVALVFASDDQSSTARAQATAGQAFDLLHARSPAFASAAGIGYWKGNHDDFSLTLFFLDR